MTDAEKSQGRTYTTDEAARVLGMNRDHVATLCRRGVLTAHMEHPVGRGAWRRWIIAAESVHAFTPTWRGQRFFNIYPGRAERKRTPRPYLDAVCRVYELTPDALLAAGRAPLCVEARRVLSYLLYADAGCGMVEIARLTRRDHSSASHAIMMATEHPTEEVTWAIAECRDVVATRRAEKARVAG